ncbi:MAG: pilin [Candidatus Moraniibacteriota bacterium]
MKSLDFKKIITSGVIGVFMLFGFFNFTLAACPSGSTDSICFENPLSYSTVDDILTALLIHLQGIIVVISMVFIVIGALLYMTSAGNDGRMTTAKGAIVAAVIGLAIGIAAPSFLKEIYTALGRSTASETLISSAPSIAEISLNVLNFLLGIVGVVGIIMLVAAGIAYLTAAGNEGQIETAKKMTKWAIVGIAVAMGALVIVKQLASFF